MLADPWQDLRYDARGRGVALISLLSLGGNHG
jgi:hypothetical protein